jgi:hypothetical protein
VSAPRRRTALSSCHSRPGPLHQGIEGSPEFLVKVARCAVNDWAMENGCKPEPDKPDPPVEQPGWGVPLEAWIYDCSPVTNDRGDTRLTLYDVSERAPFKNNSGEPGGHIWPGSGGSGVFAGGDYPPTESGSSSRRMRGEERTVILESSSFWTCRSRIAPVDLPGRRLFTGTSADMAAACRRLAWATWHSTSVAAAATRARNPSPVDYCGVGVSSRTEALTHHSTAASRPMRCAANLVRASDDRNLHIRGTEWMLSNRLLGFDHMALCIRFRSGV